MGVAGLAWSLDKGAINIECPTKWAIVRKIDNDLRLSHTNTPRDLILGGILLKGEAAPAIWCGLFNRSIDTFAPRT
jgi:hypothetical protein